MTKSLSSVKFKPIESFRISASTLSVPAIRNSKNDVFITLRPDLTFQEFLSKKSKS